VDVLKKGSAGPAACTLDCQGIVLVDVEGHGAPRAEGMGADLGRIVTWEVGFVGGDASQMALTMLPP